MNRLGTACLAMAFSMCSWADTLLIENVNGYTLDSERELIQFNALLIDDDRVQQLFAAGASLPENVDRIVDGAGRTLIPGLIDAHGHVSSYGTSLLTVDLVGAQSEQEAAERVRVFAEENPELEWIQGRGWNQVLWDSNEFPAAASLDAVVPDRPVWLRRVDGHAAWANSLAMELAEINPRTEDPSGGQIIRDQRGNATGVFVDNAMGLVSQHVPQPSIEELRFILSTALEGLAGYGLTSVHDAGIYSDTIAAYRGMLEDGPLPIRVYAMLRTTDQFYLDRLRDGFVEDTAQTFSLRSVKISADGALGSRGAALIEEYSDQPGHTGLLLHSRERLDFFMRAAMNAGFQVNTHAIGDNANMIVMDNYEALIAETDTRALRHRIEHAQVLRYEDIARFARLGVIPSMQATHATSDKNMAQDRLGEVRIQGAYAWRKLLDTGAIIANGSDFPVESPNPFFGLHASVTRQSHDNEPPGGWFPEESMTLVEALASFTIDAAYAAHQEDLLGTLEPGKKADFILLDRDLFTIDPAQLWQVEVDQTWVDGRLVFDRQ